MNVFNRVTLQSLKKNKTRTVVTVIGIMLSAAMICAVTTFVSSIQNYILQYAVYTSGDWHAKAESVSYDEYKSLSASKEIENTAYGQLLGYAKIDSKNEYKPYLYVIGAEPSRLFETLPVHLTSGRLPQSTSEIILPKHLSENGGVDYALGDKLTLAIGDRTLDGASLNQSNPCYFYDKDNNAVINKEIIKNPQSREYTVVGFFERPSFEGYTAPGFTAMTVADKTLDKTASLDVYFKMKKAADVYDFMEKNTLSGDYNSDVLNYSGAMKYSGFTFTLVSLAVIIIALIMFGSISLIYNAFSISVSERTKQFGLLSSIGATKKQLKAMVRFEAFAVSAVGIPLGIAVGIGGIAVTLLIIGNKFNSVFGSGFNLPMRVCVSPLSVAVAALVAFITVLISAVVPSRRATKITAVEAIRQSTDIKAEKRALKTSRLTYKLFGLSGVLASKHYRRNKKKYKSTVVSLFMSIVLFVSASAFTDYLMESASGGIGKSNYDLRLSGIFGETEDSETDDEILEILSSDKYVTDSAYVRRGIFAEVSASENRLNKGFLKNYGSELAQGEKEGEKTLCVRTYFVDDNSFKKLLAENALNQSDYYNPSAPKGLAVDGGVYFDTEKGKYVKINALRDGETKLICATPKNIEGYTYNGYEVDVNGQRDYCYENDDDWDKELNLSRKEACISYSMTVGKVIREAPFFITLDSDVQLSLIYPEGMIDSVIPDNADIDRSEFYRNFYLVSENHTESLKGLKNKLEEIGIDSDSLTDYAEQEEMDRNIVIIIKVFAYGFIVLISLIAAANVFNTISTNISLRRREFAMLKSVGMTNGGFNRMMNYECILYGSKALILGLPVSAVISYLIYLSFSGSFETAFRLPLAAIAVAVFSVFAVVFVTMLYSMSKIKKENPIDALKNENL